MSHLFSRRSLLAVLITTLLVFGSFQNLAAKKIKLRLASSGSPTETRAVAMEEKFRPMVEKFADYEPHWNATLFKQGTELEAITRGNLEMALASAQELAVFIPDFSVFGAGYIHRDPDHQVKVFNNKLMRPFKKKAEKKLKLKLLSVMYRGTRQLNLRPGVDEIKVNKPEDLKSIRLRMPGTDAWQFLGKALGANPVPMAFSEVYTGMQTGTVDGQDNPITVAKDKKLYEVSKQIVLTSHLVDLNYISIGVKVWKKLSKKQRRTVQKAADAAAKLGREMDLQKEKELIAFLEGKGMTVYKPDVEAFRKRVTKMFLNSEFSKTWPKGVVKKIQAL